MKHSVNWAAESVFLLPTIVRLRVARVVLLAVAVICYVLGWRIDALLMLVAALVVNIQIIEVMLREERRRIR
jgi:D-alanyl-lipoteichoic acid acyltransferase DltB (MBOAT superfamily)